MRFLLILLSLSTVLFSLNLNDLAVFSIPASTKVALIVSTGRSWGLGMGLKDKDFEFGFSFPNGVAFASYKSSKKFVILNTESANLVVSGSTMENFSYLQVDLQKTPPILRIAAKLSALPRCRKGDEKCLEKRREMESVLNTLFESSLIYRKISAMRIGYSLACASVPPLPTFGFYSSGGFTFAGLGRTDGKSAVVFGPGWGDGFGMGIGTSFGDPVRVDIAFFGGEGGFRYSAGVQIDAGKVKFFAVLSQDGFRVVLF